MTTPTTPCKRKIGMCGRYVRRFEHQHREVCEQIVDGKKVVRSIREFVLHGLRYTFLTGSVRLARTHLQS
jgi:hypothetical protein